MKKIITSSAIVLAFTGAVFAQGTVAWNTLNPNYMNGGTDNSKYSTFVGASAGQATGIAGAGFAPTPVDANGFYYQLLYQVTGSQLAAPTSLSELSAFSVSPNQTAVNNTGTPGRVTVINSQVQSQTPADWGPQIKATIVIVGWSANLGTTWAEASSALNNWDSSYIANAYFGVTSSGYISPNNIGANGATLVGATSNANGSPINGNLTALYLLSSPNSVPEPGTMALAALGGASLLLFRRRK